MQPNTALKDAVFATLKPFLGRYSLSGKDRGLAWHVVESSSLANDTLPAGTVASGLEAIFSVFPEASYTMQHEFGDGGLKGVLYHSLTLKQWSKGSIMPAYAALVEANPLMTLSSHRQPRQVPTDLNETLVVWVPWQT